MSRPLSCGAARIEKWSVTVRNVTRPWPCGFGRLAGMRTDMSASSGRCQPMSPGPEMAGVFASTVDIARPARRLNCSSGFEHSTPRKRLMPAPSDVG
jgi:hypothetical protein